MSKVFYLKEKESQIYNSHKDEWDSIHTPNIDPEKESYMVTVPYPYSNGQLHLGHLFTYLHAEFDANYHQGKYNVLFPFAYHATGMPIVAAANKVKYELENPDETPKTTETTETNTYRSAKSKLAVKQGTTQIQTLLKMGIKKEDIPKFVEPWYWVTYFIPGYQNLLQQMGFGIDWSRQFTTTSRNSIYDTFVNWQFKHLYEKGKLKYGKRYTIYSPKDNQPCQDHDRSSGEGVQCQEYTLVPFILQSDTKYKLLVATMRPETMFGVTNIWIHPDLSYGVYEHQYEDMNDVVVMLPKSANNLQYQGHKLSLIKEIKGSELVGEEVFNIQAPKDRKLYVLPMYQISENKGTGIVSSVPTESPDDYLYLKSLVTPNHPNQKKMNQTFPNIPEFDATPVPIIETNFNDKLTNQIAIDFCLQNNIKNPSSLNGQKLQEAKRTIYNNSKKGTFIHNQKTVSETIKELTDEYTKNHLWMPYAEPESEVISRSNDICVASLDNQWYIDYGESEWKQQVKEHMAEMEFYSDKGRHQFEYALEWLGQWACSRTIGLGTTLKVPCPNPDDKNVYMIDSLSDSTIYMALYTIYDILKTLPPEYITIELFDVVYLDVLIPESLKPIENLINQMRKSFDYWYPMDIRISGKDLIQNHFLMCLYNHVAIFPKKYWPKSFRTNGHITINQKKMSKSNGNFITGERLLAEYGSDASRLAMAYGSPDPVVDTNFEGKKKLDDGIPSLDMINASFSKLYEMYNWVDDVIEKFSSYRTDEMNFFDELLLEQIRVITIEAQNQMEKHVHCEAIQQTFNNMLTHRTNYLKYTRNNPHQNVISVYLEYFARLNASFIPFISEYIYQNLNQMLKKKVGSVRRLSFPEPLPEKNPDALHKYMFINNTSTIINRKITRMKQHPKKIMIEIGTNMEDWQLHVIEIINKMLESKTPDEVLKTNAPVLNKDEKMQEFIKTDKLNFKKKVQPFVSIYIKFNDMFKFDRLDTLIKLQPFLNNYFDADVTVTKNDEIDVMNPEIKCE